MIHTTTDCNSVLCNCFMGRGFEEMVKITLWHRRGLDNVQVVVNLFVSCSLMSILLLSILHTTGHLIFPYVYNVEKVF
jgi:hypothetical protein